MGKVNGAVVPIFSVLMTGKTEALYREVFRMLVVRLEGITISHIKTDFEKALMNAARHEFHGVSISGCWFHFCQSLFRYKIYLLFIVFTLSYNRYYVY